MRKIKVLMFFLFIGTCLKAQFLLYEPIRDRIFRPAVYANTKGTPFLNENLEVANVYVARGFYQSVPIIYDAYARKLYFQYGEDLFEFSEPVYKFVITSDLNDSTSFKTYVKGFESADFSSDDFLEELVRGKYGLYKLNQVFVFEEIQFGVGLVKSFKHTEKHYLRFKSTFSELKYNKNYVLAKLKDKSELVDAYVNKNSLSYKKVDDLVKIFYYYNQLKN